MIFYFCHVSPTYWYNFSPSFEANAMDWAITFFSMETTDVQLMTMMKITPFRKTIFFSGFENSLFLCIIFIGIVSFNASFFYVTYHKSSIIKTLPDNSHVSPSPFFQARKVTKHHPSFLIPHNQINKTV